MILINNLCTKSIIGGAIKFGKIEDIFDGNIHDTRYPYLWDDTNNKEEGLEMNFHNPILINRIELYSTSSYPLGNVDFILDDNVIFHKDFVSFSDPGIFKILIFGQKDIFLLTEDNNEYSIKDEFYNSNLQRYYALNKNNDTMYNLFLKYGFGFEELLNKKTISDETFIPINKFDKFKLKKIKLN